MKRIMCAGLMGFSLLASGCELMSALGGPAYTEERVAENRYRISYKAPKGAKASLIADRTLARAAQATLDKGNEWFEIAGKIEGEDAQTLIILMGRGETLAGGASRKYDAKATLASLKDKIS